MFEESMVNQTEIDCIRTTNKLYCCLLLFYRRLFGAAKTRFDERQKAYKCWPSQAHHFKLASLLACKTNGLSDGLYLINTHEKKII
jgi:hypothetical protein